MIAMYICSGPYFHLSLDIIYTCIYIKKPHFLKELPISLYLYYFAYLFSSIALNCFYKYAIIVNF